MNELLDTRDLDAIALEDREGTNWEWLYNQLSVRNTKLLKLYNEQREFIQVQRQRLARYVNFYELAMALVQVADSFQGLADGLRKIADRCRVE